MKSFISCFSALAKLDVGSDVASVLRDSIVDGGGRQAAWFVVVADGGGGGKNRNGQSSAGGCPRDSS